jgi:tetratricopeptide (TPR) repeat protein
MARSESLEPLLTEAYRLISSLDLESAKAVLEQALAVDFDDEELLYTIKAATWWTDASRRPDSFNSSFEEGEYIISRSKAFKTFLSRIGEPQERCIQAFKRYAYGMAIAKYSAMQPETDLSDPELMLRIGMAYKSLGDYVSAIKHLEAAAALRREDAAVLAELADVYALVNEVRRSKALFREAFFINPQRIDYEGLESGLMIRLVQKVHQFGKEGLELPEWIPIYGEILGIFSVRRELKPIEIGKLKQSIYELETELAADGTRRLILLPRLINRYFWLTDYYLNQKDEKSKVDEILLKIKLLDPTVHKLYLA